LGARGGDGLTLGFLRNSDGSIAAVSDTTKAMLDAHEDNWNPDPAQLPDPTYNSDYSLPSDYFSAPPPPPWSNVFSSAAPPASSQTTTPSYTTPAATNVGITPTPAVDSATLA